MSELGILPIKTKFLQRNYLFALRFEEGYVFGRVVDRGFRIYKPFVLVDSSGNPEKIDAKGHLAETRLFDPRNTQVDILYITDLKSPKYPWFLHGSIGISPPGVKMYMRVPEGKDIYPAKFPDADVTRPSAGHNTGYIDYDLSPYEEPTDVAELVIPPRVHVGFEFYNANDFAVVPKLNLMFCLYQVQFFDPTRQRGIIRAIATRSVPAAFLTAGSDASPLTASALIAEWNLKPMELEEAAGVT